MRDLAAERCLNHLEREAAARCPDCRRHFCRECVTEHAGRMLCAGCIARTRQPEVAPARGRFSSAPWRAGARALRLATGVLAAWATFYLLGQALTLLRDPTHVVPPAVHSDPIAQPVETPAPPVESAEDEAPPR